MLRNYIAAAFRHLLRNRPHAGISIFGLAFGITAALLTALVLRSELTYDNFISHPERAYLVGMQQDTRAVERLYWADPDTFRVLPMPTIAGDAIDALHRPDGVVITREIARKYFQREVPLAVHHWNLRDVTRVAFAAGRGGSD